MSLGPGSIVRSEDNFVCICGDDGTWAEYESNGVTFSEWEFDLILEELGEDRYEVLLEADPVKSLDSLPEGSVVVGTDPTMAARKAGDGEWWTSGFPFALRTDVMLDSISSDGTYRVVYRGEEN